MSEDAHDSNKPMITPNDFEIWQRAFYAALSGPDGGRPDEVVEYARRVAEEAVLAVNEKGKGLL